MRPAVALVPLLFALTASAHDVTVGDIPVSHLGGGGPAETDCLAGLEVTGVDLDRRVRTVVCEDGDPICDRDRLVNGRCELWVRVCLNETDDARCTARGVDAVAVGAPDTDRDLGMLARTLVHVATPAENEGACAPLTTFTVPLGTRRNGTKQKGRKLVALTETREHLADLLRERSDTPGITITIGNEHKDPKLESFTIVTAQYHSGSIAGVIGVIGPTRMPYDKVISLVTHTSRLLTDLLE